MSELRQSRTGLQASVELIDRRALILSGLAAAGVLLPCSRAFPESFNDVPQFRSAGHQFTLLQPRGNLPNINLERLGGGWINLTALRGKPILINFWASWCAACRLELPILEKQYRGAWQRKVHVLAVSVDHATKEYIRKFVQSLNISALPLFVDPTGNIAYSDRDNIKGAPFALYGMPITYLAASSGTIIGYMAGIADWSQPEASNLIEYLRNS